MSSEFAKVAVIGSGSWGTAFAGLAARNASQVVLWCRRQETAESINAGHVNPVHLTGYELPSNVCATASYAEALLDAQAVVLALPSLYLRATCRALAPYLGAEVPVLVLTKGMEAATHKLMLDVAADELGGVSRLAVLSGPNHAEEICQGQVSAAVCASSDLECAKTFARLATNPCFRVYVSQDVTGVEVCGTVKNVIAIASGVAAGLGAGDNTLAVIMTRGIAEISRVCAALGGDPMTPMGLAGMGDLVATCTSAHSRNRTFGEAIVRGETLAQYEQRTGMVVEGARAAASILDLAQTKSIEVPITKAVHDVLLNGIDIESAKESLLGRLPREEFYGMAAAGQRGDSHA